MYTDIQLLQIKNAVMRVLHVPGNYSGGILEMAIVLDGCVPAQRLAGDCARLCAALKRTDEVFRNVRLNLIKWISDERIIKEISSLAALQMGKGFDGMESAQDGKEKSLDELLRQLKLFYARSKLILVITDGDFQRKDEGKIQEYLHPFLGRKLIVLMDGGVVRL